MKEINNVLNYTFQYNKHIGISVKTILLTITIIIVTAYFLKFLKKLIVTRLRQDDKNKFVTVFSFGKWLIYIIIFLTTLSSSGVNVSAIFAASAALLIGVGLALQTFFQDIISGIFIIVDQSVHVGDVIEIEEGKIGRIEEIKLRTTRAVTIDNKVMVIPNHKYLMNKLYNWTQNGNMIRETVTVGVAYGSDVHLVKKLLLQAAKEHPEVLNHPAPMVVFDEFAESSLDFKLIFSVNNSFEAFIQKSDLRFRIDELFRSNNVSIPFPQRDVYIKQS